jgi:hypothetical protein
MINQTSIKARQSVLGISYLARIFASFTAACTHHTWADGVVVNTVAAIVT